MSGHSIEHTKHRLPNLPAVQAKLKSVLESGLTNFLHSTHSRRLEVVGNRRFTILSFFFAIAVIVALFFIRNSYGALVTNVLVGCAMVWLLLVLLTGRRWVTNDRLLAKEMSMALVPVLTNVFDRLMIYSHDSDNSNAARALLADSELMTIDDVKVVSDDVYTVFGNKEVSFSELLVTKKLEVADNTPEKEVELFRGVLVVAGLGRAYRGETYVSTEGDRSGFAHRTFWSDVLENSDVKETVLEWNDFEKDLHVASSDPVETREILNPEFMKDLYEWWLDHKLNVRISFKDDKMYLLLPESSIQMSESTTSTKLSSIERYAWSLARPMWRSLVLVDDVSKRPDMV